MKIGLLSLALGTLLLGANTDAPRKHYAGMPPVEYWGEATAIVIFADNVAEHCDEAPPGYVVRACARSGYNGAPVLVLPNPCYYGAAGEKFATLACHEKSHRPLGWPGDHPR